MMASRYIYHGAPTPLYFLAVLLVMFGLATTGAGAEIIKKEDMIHGFNTTHAQCDATPQTVWLKVDAQDFCIRYYLSTVGGDGNRPLVFLQGDRFGKANMKTRQWVPPPTGNKMVVTFEELDGDIDTGDLIRLADTFSKMTKTAAIYLARMGIEGSSGNHIYRHSMLELDVMNAALDAIKRRHEFEGFHLAGQSGGALLVTGLVATRHDIGCAVSGSGGPFGSGDNSVKDISRPVLNPLQFVPSIGRNNATRFLVVTDRQDLKVPASKQIEFVEKLRRAGRSIPQFFVTAVDENHHGVLSYTQLVSAGCILGKSDAQIATAVGTMVKRNAAFIDLRRTEMAALSKTGAPPKPPIDADSAPTGRHFR